MYCIPVVCVHFVYIWCRVVSLAVIVMFQDRKLQETHKMMNTYRKEVTDLQVLCFLRLLFMLLLLKNNVETLSVIIFIYSVNCNCNGHLHSTPYWEMRAHHKTTVSLFPGVHRQVQRKCFRQRGKVVVDCSSFSCVGMLLRADHFGWPLSWLHWLAFKHVCHNILLLLYVYLYFMA